MSDPPFDPFGRTDRTIIRPNPGGRRPVAPPLHATPPGAPAAPPPPAGGDWATPPQAPFQQHPHPSHSQPQPGAPPGAAPVPGAAVGDLMRQGLLAPSANPLLRSAGPLLLLIGRLRVALSKASAAQLMEQVATAIQEFENEVRQAGLPPEQIRAAKYVLCATADDIVQNIPGEDRHVWTQYSMLSRFFGERTGGVRFFEELDRAKGDPSRNYHLLELMHVCLALGFQGMHRSSQGGTSTLQQMQRNLYEILRRVQQRPQEISPRWRGQQVQVQTARTQVPVWAVGAVAGVALLGLYVLLQMFLAGRASAVAAALRDAHPTSPIALGRHFPVPQPPPPPPLPVTTQLQRIKGALAPELASAKVTVEETPTHIIVRVANLALFASGDATVREEFKPVADRISAMLDKEPGTIRIIGHTDSAPIKSVRFPSNFHLSVERAKAVAALLRQRMTQPDRLSVDGKGADAPAASNDTPEGRAKNRRVEVLIPRSG